MLDVSTPVTPQRRRRRISANVAWPLGFLAAAIGLFIFYYVFYYGDLNNDVIAWAQRWIPLLTMNEMLVWVICALGLNIVVGYAGLLDLGFVAFWAIGGYTAGWFMSDKFPAITLNIFGSDRSQEQNTPGLHFNFWIVLVLGAVICAFFGVLIGAPTLRLRSDYLALVTLGFGEIIPQIFKEGDDFLGTGFNLTDGSKGIGPIDSIHSAAFDQDGSLVFRDLGPFDLLPKYVIFVLLAALIIFISLRLRVGRLGRAWLAIREDELAASSMGIPLMRTKLAAYGIGAVAGGLAGVAYATHVSRVEPSFKFSTSIILLAMVVLGGMGNVWGVTIGALILSWINSNGLKQVGDSLNEGLGVDIDLPSYNFLIFGLILVLMMLFRREGLLPEARTRLVLREPGRTEAESLGADMEEPAPELEELPEERLHHVLPDSPADPPPSDDRDADGPGKGERR